MSETLTRQQGKPIRQQQFYRIMRDIKARKMAGTYKSEDVAGRHGVSPETVRAIKRAGTWPQFCRNKAERRRHVLERQQFATSDQTSLPIDDGEKRLADDLAAMDQETVTIAASDYKMLKDERDYHLKRAKRLARELDNARTVIASQRPKRRWPWGRR